MAIQTQIDRINNAVNAQTDLIAQIQTALQGKAAGGGSGGSSVETCTVTIVHPDGATGNIYYTTVNDSGKIVGEYIPLSSTVTIMCLCGSCVAVRQSMVSVSIVTENCEPLGDNIDPYNTYYHITATANTTATITFIRDSSGGAD